MSCGIYLITNKINDKIYVGQSINIEFRWQVERWGSKNSKRDTQIILRAIHKYGIDNFKFEIIEELPKDRKILNDREKYWIQFYESSSPSKGYNLTNGGQDGHLGVKRSEKTKQRISKALAGKPKLTMRGKPSGMAGKIQPKEARQKISMALKNKPFRPHGPMPKEHRQRIRDGWTKEAKAMAAKRARNQPKATGWHHSEEARKKLSVSKKGKPATNKGIPRTEAQKLNDRNIALKRHLAKGKPCLRFTDIQGNVQYFVSEFEAATQLTGEFSPATLIMRMTCNPAYIPLKKSSLGWRVFQGCRFDTCSQAELLEHRPELK